MGEPLVDAPMRKRKRKPWRTTQRSYFGEPQSIDLPTLGQPVSRMRAEIATQRNDWLSPEQRQIVREAHQRRVV